MEINRLIAKNPRLDISKIDRRLRGNTSVDIRVVINWNMDNTDVDLYVKDHHVKNTYSGKCYFCNWYDALMDSGWRVSANNTDGYGPEQFFLRNAKKGKYQIYVNYSEDRRFTESGPLTVMAEIYIKYAGKAEQRKVVCLQLSNVNHKGDGKVLVAEFEI